MQYSKLNCLRLLLFAVAGTLFADNIVVLPSGTNGSNVAHVLSGTPLTEVASFPVPPSTFAVFAKPAFNPTATTYYLISKSDTQSVTVLNGNFQPIAVSFNIGGVTAAAMAPDGSKVLLTAGGTLHVLNTANNTLIAVPSAQIGAVPEDLAVTPDSRYAFVLSNYSHNLSAVDLTDNSYQGSLLLPNISSATLAISPTGLLYISAHNRIIELEPSLKPFSSKAIRRQWAFPGAEMGRLSFSPDGSQAIALNRSPQSGGLLVALSLDLIQSSVTTVSTANAAFNGLIFEKVVFISNTKAYGISTAQAYPPSRIYEITLPLSQPGSATTQPPTVTDAYFSSLNVTPYVGDLALSPEALAPKQIYLTSFGPGQDTNFLTVDALANPPRETSVAHLPNAPFSATYLSTPVTPVQEAPASYFRYNARQVALAPGTRSAPFAVRVLGTSGRPIWNATVNFQTSVPGAALEFTSVSTNLQGYAFTTVVAPSAIADLPVNFSVAGSNLTGVFTFNMAASGLRGRGGTEIISGDGQVVKVGNFTQKPLKIRVVDANLVPIAGELVVWSVTEGAGTITLGTQIGAPGSRITTTDAQGYTENSFISSSLIPYNSSSVRSTVTASTTTGSASFYVVIVPAYNSSQSLAPNPSVLVVTPAEIPATITGKAGQILPKAIQVRIVAGALPFTGQPLQWVGIHPTTGYENNLQAGPAVACVPAIIPLSEANGIATCDLKLLGKPGTTAVNIDIGGFNLRQVQLTVLPSEPSSLTIVSGNNQTAGANVLLPVPLSVVLDDGAGNTFSGLAVNWDVISGNATITNPVTVTDQSGRVSTTVRLGALAGPVQIRATAQVATLPTATFTLRVDIAAAAFIKVSGDSQVATVNTNFANPLVVQVKDTNGAGMPGQLVTFSLTGGIATISGSTVTTDANGLAQINLRAGTTAGPVVVTASTPAIATPVVFTLTAQPPGPSVNQADFYNAASGERGAIVPGSLYNMTGTGLAPDLVGCITPNNIIGPVPTRLNGVEVQFGTVKAPILNVCNLNGVQSVAIQVPFFSAADVVTQAVVSVNAVTQTVNNIKVVDLQPGIFETIDQNGRRSAVALRPNGTWVTPENPALIGEVVRIYMTGHGTLTPAGLTNQPGNAGLKPTAAIAIAVNSDGARVVDAHAMEGMVGVVQVSFEVPAGTVTGPARPLGIVMIRPGTSDSVFQFGSPTIAIAP